MIQNNAKSVEELFLGPKSTNRLAILFYCIILLYLSTNSIVAQEITLQARQLYEQATSTTDFDEKISLLETATQSSPLFVEARVELAKTLIEIDKYHKAISHLDAALNYELNNAYVWFQKGRAHTELSEYNTALKCLKRAIDLKEDVPEFHLQLGEVYYQNNLYLSRQSRNQTGLTKLNFFHLLFFIRN